jgi:phage-related protein
MPSSAALELVVQLKDSASEGLDKIGEKGGALGPLVSGGALAAGGAVVALGGFLVEAAKSASEEQEGMDRLGTTMKANIPNFTGSEDAAEGFVTKMESLAFSDDAARDSLNKLIPRTHDLGEAQKLTTLAADLARSKNIDLSTATDIVGKVYGGNVGVLGRYGIQVDKNATSTEALAAIQAMAGGQAETYANSTAGSADRLKVAMGDAMETIGHAVLNIVSGPLQALANWFTSPQVQAAIQSVADFIGTTLTDGLNQLGAGITAIQPMLDGLFNFMATVALPAAQGLFNFLQQNALPILIVVGAAILSSVVPAFIAWATAAGAAAIATIAAMAPVIAAAAPFIALGLVVAGLVVAFQNNFLGIHDAVTGAMTAITGALSPFWTEIQPKLLAAWNAISSTAVNAWNFMSGIITGGLNALVGMWNSNWGGIQTIVQGAWTFIQGIVTAAWQIVSGIIQIGLDALSGNWSGVWTDIQTMLSGVWDTITTQILPGAITLIGQILTNFIPTLISTLAQWTGAFMNWVLTDVVPKLPGWLATLGQALWDWITSTATDLGTKLVTQWLPAFWLWLTGPSGVLVGIGAKLTEAWVGFTNWVNTTIGNIGATVAGIGGAMIEGIKSGISNGWDSFKSWLTGLLGGAVDAVKHFFGIGSPSKLMADEVGAPLVQGIQAGIGGAWSALQSDLGTRVQGLSGSVGIGVSGRGLSLAGASAGGGVSAGPVLAVQNVNVYAYPGMDSGQFATSFIQALEEELSASSRARRT